jgi:DNA-binding protein HU-beta/integration host factor subunit beta
MGGRGGINMAVTKKQIVCEIARRTGLTQVDSGIIVEELLAAISRALIGGRNIEIRGFGRFKLRKRLEHLARNPRSGVAVKIRAGIKPVFQASRELKSRVNASEP